MAINSEAPAFEVTELTKHYGSTTALDGASFSCRRGEVHGLVGENGAGKSTLVKILSGLIKASHGHVLVDGQPVKFRSPRDAIAAGIATAFQELTLIPYMTVAENLLMGREPRGAGGLVSKTQMNAVARRTLEEWGAGNIDPEATAGDISLAVQQRVEIVRALSRRTPVLLLDEPTSALGAAEATWLLDQVQRLRAGGTTIVFISHRVGEISGACDRITVLRNGKDVGTVDPTGISQDDILRLMLGRSAEEEYATTATSTVRPGPPALAVDGLASAPELRGVTFGMQGGELLGVAGLEGQGQKALFMTLFGARKRDGGMVVVDGKPLRLRSPRDAMRSGMGIGLVPEDRKAEGLMLKQSALFNASLPGLGHLSKLGFVKKRAERAEVREILRRLDVPIRALDNEVQSLSGGNQQKVVISKWLLTGARVLLMYDPTRGVDVATKAEIFALMRKLVADGHSILFYSTDIEELVNVCERVLVFYGGRIVRELSGDELTREELLAAILGSASQATAGCPQ